MYKYEMIKSMNINSLEIFLNEIRNMSKDVNIHDLLMEQATQGDLAYYNVTINIMDIIKNYKKENISLKRQNSSLGNKGNRNRGKRKNADNL